MSVPYRFQPTATAASVREKHGDIADGSETGETVTVAGRLMLRREQGKLAFGTGKVANALKTSDDVVKDFRLLTGNRKANPENVNAAFQGLEQTGHLPATDSILIGELAPEGGEGRRHSYSEPMPPMPFLRALYCVDQHYRPLTGTAAEQKTIIEDLLAQQVQAIAISVNDPVNQLDFLNRVADRIPLITQDNDSPSSKRVSGFLDLGHFEIEARACALA